MKNLDHYKTSVNARKTNFDYRIENTLLGGKT